MQITVIVVFCCVYKNVRRETPDEMKETPPETGGFG